MVVYNKAADDADNVSLELLLHNSIKQLKEQQMAKKNGKKKSERASVSRERRLALALRAVLDADALGVDGDAAMEQSDATQNAIAILDELGYGSLVGIPKRMKQLNEQLEAAVADRDGAAIARIGAEMVKVQAGKEPTAEKAKAAGGE